MILLLLPYPDIKPEIFSIGPFAVRWYALAYIAGLVIGWQIMRRVCTQPPKVLSPEKIDDFLLWAALGVILGGRMGYVLFYKPSFFLENPLQILTLWEGGMSFHGGLLGVITAILAFSFKNGISPFLLSDLVALVAPIGLFFGRIANFINGELWGRPTDVPWAMIFPRGGPLPRHPSQLYQATFEGILLFSARARGLEVDRRAAPARPDHRRVLHRLRAWRASSARSSASPMRSSASCRRTGSPWACCCRCRCWRSAPGWSSAPIASRR